MERYCQRSKAETNVRIDMFEFWIIFWNDPLASIGISVKHSLHSQLPQALGPSALLIAFVPPAATSYSSSLSALLTCCKLSSEIPPLSVGGVGGPTWLMKSWLGGPFLFNLQWEKRTLKSWPWCSLSMAWRRMYCFCWNYLEVQHKTIKPYLPVIVGIFLFEESVG